MTSQSKEPKAHVFQIFYSDGQKVHLDKNFRSYDNSTYTHPFNFEYAVFFRLYPSLNWTDYGLNGTVSWKFKIKTGLNGEDYLNQIANNPGYDVYFVNPAQSHICFNSVWEQGEIFHPGITQKTADILKAAGYDTEFLGAKTPPNLTAYCNYWVGTERFWNEYISFLTPLWNFLNSPNGTEVLNDTQQADISIKAPILPFIFERLFSTFLSINNFKVFQIEPDLKSLNSNPITLPFRRYLLKMGKKSRLNFIERSLAFLYFYAAFSYSNLRRQLR